VDGEVPSPTPPRTFSGRREKTMVLLQKLIWRWPAPTPLQKKPWLKGSMLYQSVMLMGDAFNDQKIIFSKTNISPRFLKSDIAMLASLSTFFVKGESIFALMFEQI